MHPSTAPFGRLAKMGARCEHHHGMEKERASKVRAIQNPEARFKAKLMHLLATKHTPDPDKVTLARTSKKQRVLDDSAAVTATVGAAVPLPEAEAAEVAAAALDVAQ